MSAKNIIPTASNLWGKKSITEYPHSKLIFSQVYKHKRKSKCHKTKSKVNTPVNVFVAWLDRHVPLSVKILSSSPRRLSKLLFFFFFFYCFSILNMLQWKSPLTARGLIFAFLLYILFLYILLKSLTFTRPYLSHKIMTHRDYFIPGPTPFFK